MKIFSRFSKALGAGALAAVLLVASSGNQVALGAATATTLAPPSASLAASSEMWWAAITGDFVQGIMDGLRNGIGSTQENSQQTLAALQPHYHTTDFSQFD